MRVLIGAGPYLRLQLAKARRERFGRSSERAGDLLDQLPLLLGEAVTATSQAHNTERAPQARSQEARAACSAPESARVPASRRACACRQ
ncbi:hypothetical protein [Allopusillimonas ginsengisoli]|uniref:IS66 family transposase n=1 Tax=Allopusillimonas ginsengisoli TaxID=453575 RepID=UPI003CC8A996